MDYKRKIPAELQVRIKGLLSDLGAERERHPLQLAKELGYLMYVRVFIESQHRDSLASFFPYAGFPMEWPDAGELPDDQLLWQVQYEIRYCASIVEEGHFMEQARLPESADRIRLYCRFIDEVAAFADWSSMPRIFPDVLEEMIAQIYGEGREEFFFLPEPVEGLLLALAGEQEKKSLWQPGCTVGSFLAAWARKGNGGSIRGSGDNKEQSVLAAMLLCLLGVSGGEIRTENALTVSEEERFDIIMAHPPVGELSVEEQDRFAISTRKVQLQYLQLAMEHLKDDGMAMMIVNEGVLFMHDAERKVREKLVNDYCLHAVISLPAGAFLPYTVSKASVLVFSKTEKKTDRVWFTQLNTLGYSLDRKQEPLSQNDIPRCVETWNARSGLEDLWVSGMEVSGEQNRWENPVPVDWDTANGWFAERSVIEKNEYNLTAGRYRPDPVDKEEKKTDPRQLLGELTKMEEETMRQLQDLIAMVNRYEG